MAKRSADLTQFTIQKPTQQLAVEEAAAPPSVLSSGRRVLIKKSLQVTPEAARGLALIKAETGRKENELLAEALNLLFKKYGKPQLA